MNESGEVSNDVATHERSSEIVAPVEESFVEQEVPIGGALSRVESNLSKDPSLHGIKESLKVADSVEALMVERGQIITKAEEALQYFSNEGQENSAVQVQERANFRGDWHALTRQRLEHPVGFLKYILLKLRHIENLKPGSPDHSEKPTDFRDYVLKQLQRYEETIDYVFGATEVAKSTDKGRLPTNFGSGKYGEQPVVFQDAAHRDGTPLSDHHRHIIESHEAGHGIREFIGTEGAELYYIIDTQGMTSKDSRYLSKPDEVAERMSQLKNYFGLGPTEKFTAEHLRYAREHYIEDTGLDNQMSQFFTGVTPEREEQFLRLINELPI